MTLRLIIAALAAAGVASAAAAHEYKLGDLTIGHPYATETAATARTGAGYLSIAWLLRFLRARITIPFVVYRVALGILLLALLGTGML